jgi:SanA protein
MMKDHSQYAQCGSIRWRLLCYGAAACAFLAAVPVFLRWWTDRHYKNYIYMVEGAPARDVAIVFGAGVWPDGTLSHVLADRVETAVRLYEAGKVRKLLMTGDNRRADYNEPAHMRDYALAQGVPAEDIVLDYAGRRTYASCYRARHIFDVTGAILVTQSYHLDRALFTARNLGIDAVGVAADRRDYVYIEGYWWRELLATTLAWWEVKITRPRPILGEKLPIF